MKAAMYACERPSLLEFLLYMLTLHLLPNQVIKNNHIIRLLLILMCQPPNNPKPTNWKPTHPINQSILYSPLFQAR